MSIPDFLIWHCAGCGKEAAGKTKPCDCITNVGTRIGPTGKMETTFWDEPKTPTMSESEAAVIEAAQEWATATEGGKYGPMQTQIAQAEKDLTRAVADLAAENDGRWKSPY